MGKLTEPMVLQRTRRSSLESVRELNCWCVRQLVRFGLFTGHLQRCSSLHSVATVSQFVCIQ